MSSTASSSCQVVHVQLKQHLLMLAMFEFLIASFFRVQFEIFILKFEKKKNLLKVFVHPYTRHTFIDMLEPEL